MSTVFPFAVLIVLIQCVHFSMACHGYDAKVSEVVNGDNKYVTIDSVEVKLTRNCQLYVKGCININADFSTSMVNVKIKKGWWTVFRKNDLNFCSFLNLIRIGVQCPIQPRKYCTSFDKPINIKPYSKYLYWASGYSGVRVKVAGKFDNKDTFDSFDVVIKVSSRE